MDDSHICKPSLTLTSQTDLDQLHDAATAILEETGLNVHHPEMLRQLEDAGAELAEAPLVRFPKGMVEKALGSAKKGVVVHDRKGQPVMPLGAHQFYFGTGSDLHYTLDLETGERRDSVLEDVGRHALVCDALEEMNFVMSFALPKDVPEEHVEPQQYYLMLKNTTMPVIMTSFSGLDTLDRMHQMACLIAGGEDAFRACPNYIMYGQFVSPLQHDLMAVERLIFCAEHEVPLIYIPTIMPGMSGPITLAGSLALAVAESLAGLVMHQTVNSGAPFIFGACVSRLDMRTMQFPYGSPEWRLNDLVMAELSRRYGLPVFGTAAATDSKSLDAQTGAEYASSLLVAAMAGTNLIHDVGYLDSGLTGSLESLVLGAEQIRWVREFMKGFSIAPQTLALDVTEQVGPGKQFMDQDHTLDHMQDTVWHPRVSDRGSHDSWASEGSRDYAARARDCARELLNSHQVEPIDGAIDQRLRELCGMA